MNTISIPYQQARREPMPVVSAAVSVQVVAASFWVLSSWVAAANSATNPDLMAIFGAGPGSIMALLEARTKGRSLRDTARVFLGSCTVGMFAPGIAFGIMRYWLKWIPDDAVQFITWHYWAGAGLLGSLFGWGLLHKLNIYWNRKADGFLHINSDENGDAETKEIK